MSWSSAISFRCSLRDFSTWRFSFESECVSGMLPAFRLKDGMKASQSQSCPWVPRWRLPPQKLCEMTGWGQKINAQPPSQLQGPDNQSTTFCGVFEVDDTTALFGWESPEGPPGASNDAPSADAMNAFEFRSSLFYTRALSVTAVFQLWCS